MHNRFDQFIKRLARRGFSPAGHVETDAEVSPDALRIDVWFLPDAARARKALAPLGLLGRMGRTACTIEPFHRTPSGGQVVDCFMKHRLFCRELRRRKPRPPMPTQWIISSGRPSSALAGLGFRESRWGPGIYDGLALMRTKIVVVSELPRTRDTLLVRLMGAGRTLKHAIADVRALPSNALERLLALPILVRLRLEIPTDTTKQTKSDREFLMSTQDVEEYLRQFHDEGFAQAVLATYEARFGAPPADLVTTIERSRGRAELQRWLEVVATCSADEVAAALRKPRTADPAPRTRNRRSASPRRTTAPR